MATIKLKIKTIPVSVDTEWIRLDALLKLAGAVGTGGLQEACGGEPPTKSGDQRSERRK